MTPTTTSHALRVLLISKDELFVKEAENIIQSDSQFELVVPELVEENILQAVKIEQPDILLFDYRYFPLEETFDVIDDITILNPKTATLVVIPEEEVVNANKVILAGARAFLPYPFTRASLLNTLKRVHELNTRLVSSGDAVAGRAGVKQDKSVLVFSPKGGSGCSSVAVNLAIALFQATDEELLLVDGKHLFGDVGLMLNIKTANSIVDLIPHAGNLDESLVRQIVIRHTSGIQVLPSPFSASVAQPIRPDDLFKVITGLQKIFPVMVVDGGNYLNDNVVTLMDTLERVMLVITPDLASLRNARLFMDICRTLSYPREKILLVMNKVSGRNDVSMGEVEKVLRTKIFGVIPADENIALSSLNEGVPIITKRANHPISKAYKKLAENLLEVYGTSMLRVQGDIASDMLLKTSRLG